MDTEVRKLLEESLQRSSRERHIGVALGGGAGGGGGWVGQSAPKLSGAT